MADIKKNNRLRDKKITILKRVRGYDDYGEPIDETVPIAENIWAYYRQVSGSEFFSALTANTKVDAIFNIAYRKDIDTTCKVKFRGEIYEITRIDDYEGYKETLTIYATKTN